MGMDVYGRDPKSKDGEYFRANVWSWRPIHELIQKTNILPQKLIDEMEYNDGAGPDAEQSLLLAYQLEYMIDGMSDDNTFMLTSEIDGPVAELLKNLNRQGIDIISPRGLVYEADVLHVKEFIQFCRESGGFRVC